MKFNELNAEQKEKAIEEYRDINVDSDDWNEAVKEQYYEELSTVGFSGIDSAYSGFWSQGDGASFTASNVDIEKFLRSMKCWTYYRPLHKAITDSLISAKVIRTTHQYCHENTTQAEIQGDWYIDMSPIQEKLYAELAAYIDNYITAKGKAYYQSLEKEYEYLTSDEQVQSAIESNEYEFEVDPREAGVTYL